MSRISLRLRNIRRAKNLSQEELARQLGVSRQAIIALEQGTSLPSLPVVMALLRALDIPFTELFESQWTPFRPFDEHDTADTNTIAHFRDADMPQNIPVHMAEDPTHVYITAELPGVKEEDVAVDLSSQHVLIMALKKPHYTTMTSHVQDVAYGPLLRILPLPFPIDTTQAQAVFNRGILTLTLPKTLPATKRRITFTENSQEELHGSK